jgi:hypothetical protein
MEYDIEEILYNFEDDYNPGPRPMNQGPRNMNQGGRIPFEKGGPLTGEKFVEIVEKFPDYSNKQLLEYFNKNKFTNRYGEPLNLNVITTNKSKFFDVAAEKKSQVPKGYISSAEVFENLPISKADYFRVKQAKEGGTLLTQEIDKLLKPQKVGPQQFYFKKPSKSDMKSFLRLSDKTGRLNNRIADLMIDFDKAYGKSFAKGIIPTLEDVTNKFNITDSTAGKVTTRLAQWYGGQDFKNPQLKDLKRNKVSSNRMFKTIEKSAFGNPYRDGLYQISMQTIDSKLGNKQGTFEKFKSQAKQILKDNNIPIYDPKMGKNAFGFNINEIAGVTGSAKSKAAEFSQFVDVMEGNINTKAMAGFQSKLSTARAAIEKDPTKLSVESKKINKMAKNLEKTYGVELPRLQDPDATKYFSPKRLYELKAQGLDIVKAAERAGYTIQMPKSSKTIQEFTDPKNLNQVKKMLSDLGCPKSLQKASGGRIKYSKGTSCAIKGREILEKGLKNGFKESDQTLARGILKSGKFLKDAVSLRGLFGPAALAFTAAAEAGLVGYDMLSSGKSFREAVGDSVFNYALGDKTKIDSVEERDKRMVAEGMTPEQMGKIKYFESMMDDMQTGFSNYDNIKDLEKKIEENTLNQKIDPQLFPDQSFQLNTQLDKAQADNQDYFRTNKVGELENYFTPKEDGTIPFVEGSDTLQEGLRRNELAQLQDAGIGKLYQSQRGDEKRAARKRELMLQNPDVRNYMGSYPTNYGFMEGGIASLNVNKK